MTKGGTVLIKKNNSRPSVITNMNILRDMFPNFYNVCEESNEN